MMDTNTTPHVADKRSPAVWVFATFVVLGAVAFLVGMFSHHPEKAWQAYLINFLLWSAIAQGALLFSAVMHMTNSRWC